MRSTFAIAILLLSVLAGLPTANAQANRPAIESNGLVLWLKADDGLARDGSIWKDRSGHAHDAIALPGRAPHYVANAINGLPAAQFGGRQAMSMAGAILDSQTFTVIAVVNDISSETDGGYREIISNWDPSDGDSSVFLGTLWVNILGLRLDRIRFTDAVGGADQDQSGVGKIISPKKPFILSALSSVNDAVVHLGRKTQYRLGSPLPPRDLDKPWYLGRQGAEDGEYWNGYIAEILVYDRSLPKKTFDAEIKALAAKWQLSPR